MTRKYKETCRKTLESVGTLLDEAFSMYAILGVPRDGEELVTAFSGDKEKLVDKIQESVDTGDYNRVATGKRADGIHVLFGNKTETKNNFWRKQQ